MTLTNNPNLALVKVDPHTKIKVKCQTVQLGEHRQTDGSYQFYYLPALLSLRAIPFKYIGEGGGEVKKNYIND